MLIVALHRSARSLRVTSASRDAVVIVRIIHSTRDVAAIAEWGVFG